jgi:hypothetical protein
MNTRLVNICPVENCNIFGGSLFRKSIKNGKNRGAFKYYYFEHRLKGSKSVSHYLGKVKPKIRKARAKMMLLST